MVEAKKKRDFTKTRKPESATLQAIIERNLQNKNLQKNNTPLRFYGSLPFSSHPSPLLKPIKIGSLL